MVCECHKVGPAAANSTSSSGRPAAAQAGASGQSSRNESSSERQSAERKPQGSSAGGSSGSSGRAGGQSERADSAGHAAQPVGHVAVDSRGSPPSAFVATIEAGQSPSVPVGAYQSGGKSNATSVPAAGAQSGAAQKAPTGTGDVLRARPGSLLSAVNNRTNNLIPRLITGLNDTNAPTFPSFKLQLPQSLTSPKLSPQTTSQSSTKATPTQN